MVVGTESTHSSRGSRGEMASRTTLASAFGFLVPRSHRIRDVATHIGL